MNDFTVIYSYVLKHSYKTYKDKRCLFRKNEYLARFIFENTI